MARLHAKHLDLGAQQQARTIGRGAFTVVQVGDTILTREVAQPGWRWSEDIKATVGTALCQANHQLYVVSGCFHILMEDGTELDLHPGDAAAIPPGHDGWVVGDEPCETLDFQPVYAHLIEAGDAYRMLTDPGRRSGACSRRDAAAKLRGLVRTGRLDSGAVEVVLGAVGHRPRRRTHGPCGLTAREIEVLVLLATGAATKQVAYALGITAKTASTHVERIYAKTGVSSRAAVTLFAIQHGLVNPINTLAR